LPFFASQKPTCSRPQLPWIVKIERFVRTM
jgi:hypothetical protein